MQCDTKIRLRRAAVNRTEATVGSGDRTARIQMAAPSLGNCVPFGKPLALPDPWFLIT